MIDIYYNTGEKVVCEILFVFEKNNKNFVVYRDSNDEILASYYKKQDDSKYVIQPIGVDSDYDIVDEMLEKWWNRNE